MQETRGGSAGRRGREARRTARAEQQQKRARVVWPGVEGGIYRPLSERDVERINEGALQILERIGMGDAGPDLCQLAKERGCGVTEDGRILFPRSFIEDTIAMAGRNFTLCGRDPAHDLEISGSRVHFGTAGAAVTVPDFETGRYRASTLLDLYDFGRLVDRLPNIHWFGRTVVPTELEGGVTMDVNVVYAAAAGTSKHIAAGFTAGAGIDAAVRMLDMMLGGEGRFAERPCCTLYCTGVVPPLRYGELSLEVALAATRVGMPIDFIIAAQAGATAPASLAGCLVQTTAEALGGMALVNLVKPGHPTIFSNWPFTSDLRSGSFSGGGPEEALLNAASAQIANYYDLPSGVACSMTDSKLPDNQAGYEKGVTSVLTGLSGANLIHEAAGMQASLLGCCHEALVIDSEMLGNSLRAVRGIEVSEETLSIEVIEEVVRGPGHFLGHAQTLALMESEYIYPELGDRERPVTWEERGSLDIRARARQRVKEILASHYPEHIDPAVDAKIRDSFDIRLPAEAMKPGSGRW